MSSDLAPGAAMAHEARSIGHHLGNAFSRSRLSLASALTVAFIAIFFFHAPSAPVIAGCGGAWTILLAVAFVHSWRSGGR
jgi:hypothetical protein